MVWVLVLACGLVFVTSGWLGASPSGLNNIPTVDVTPRNVLVLQGWGDFAHGASPVYLAGFKYGLPANIEIGLDSQVGADDSGPVMGQVKWRLPLPTEETLFGMLLGVAVISDDSERAGDVAPYLVSAFDFDLARLSLGYSFQENDQAFFAGLDKTLELQSRDLILRADVRQVDDGDEWLASAGFLHVLPLNLVLESWVSIPSARDAEEALTVKLNYVIAF